MKALLDFDRVSGMHTRYEFDASADEIRITPAQYLAGLLEANKAEFNGDHRRNGDGLGRKIASIPLITYFELRKAGVTRDRKAFARWLNDPDNRMFRTAPGVV